MVTFQSDRSMSTSTTPGMLVSSARTADAQASQLMPVTVMVVVLMAVLSVGDFSVADVLCTIPP